MPIVHFKPLFDRYAGVFRPSTIAPVGGSGLSGAEIFRVAAPLGMFALRCWPAEHPSADQLRTVHRVLARARTNGCGFVPVPVEALSGDTIVEFADRLWQLEPWMPGSPDLSPAPATERLEAAFSALAAFHSAVAGNALHDRSYGRSSGLFERIRVLEGCLGGDVHRVSAAFNNEYLGDWDDRVRAYFRLFKRGAPAVYDLLQLAAAREVRLQPVIRDVHREHVLFTEDEVTGLVDFGAMSVDHPAVDLARLLGSYEVDEPERRRDLVHVYNSSFGDDEHLLIDAFDRSGALLSPFRWLWWLFVEHRTFRDEAAVARRFDVLLQRLTRLVDGPSAGPLAGRDDSPLF